MDRFAILIDAGYFFAAGAQAALTAAGAPTHQVRHTSRKSISLITPDKALADLITVAAPQVGGLPLLRAYWYDAMPGSRLSLEQTTIAMLPYVKLRLGVLNNVGEQKGVDSLIVTDLIELARNGAIADAVIVSGDEDLRIAVQVAQSLGVRVHILAAGDPKTNVSMSLQMEADSVGSLPSSWFTKYLLINSPAQPLLVTAPAPAVASPVAASAPALGGASSAAAASSTPAQPTITTTAQTTGTSLDQVAEKISKELLASANQTVIASLKQHFITSKSVPPEFDGRLIAKTASEYCDRKLTGEETRHIRGVFVRTVRAV
jgi:NYN domain